MASIAPSALLSLCRSASSTCRQLLEQPDLARLLQQDGGAAGMAEAHALLGELRALVAAGSAVLAAVGGSQEGDVVMMDTYDEEHALCALQNLQLQQGPPAPSARERVLTHPDLLEEIFRMAGKPVEDLIKMHGVCHLWRDVLRRPGAWQDVLKDMPARTSDRRDPYAYVKQYLGAWARTPLVHEGEWLECLDVYIEFWESKTKKPGA